ncbi:hypothetical protein J3459_016360 [Metarhizium acridum]|uniref:uncharacterized protein n=1 Tax=Metarhizium acridum TaxID=92637 RepID=UPI001C6B2B71|nr:hypothetical protein J3458_020558 [Metarhizium acridum]KAG8411321.1 hypothetical protein J3459_016360 [Metarhizium acridum]
MDWDHLAEEHSQGLFSAWLKLLFRESPALPLRLAGRHRPESPAVTVSEFTTGSYNICCTVTFEDGFQALVRFPILGRSRFRIEKTNDELLVMGYLARFTPIPIPKLLGTGRWGCGPYIVTTLVEGTLLSHCLRDPTMQTPGLDPRTTDSDLERAYRGMAQIMLELSKPTFPAIGALGWEAGVWKVTKRPLTLNMNELVRVGNCPPKIFTDCRFRTASEYFQELATQQLLHLQYQRNNAVKDESDCQKKYVARCLFRRIARQISTHPGPFRLYCDDFRPSNVLVSPSDFTVTGVIDWEFTYVAPAEFTYSAPWWLLFESPEAWESDLSEFLIRYTPRLQLFLKVLRFCEEEQIAKGSLTTLQRLSDRMEMSMENGSFWFCLAARKSFMFDDIYWKFIDQRHFGPLSSLNDRLSLLTQHERDAMPDFIQAKMQQAREKTLETHLTFDETVDL